MKRLTKIAGSLGTAVASFALMASSVSAATSTASDTAGAGIGIAMMLVWCVAALVGIGLLVFTVMMIIDVNKRDEKVLPKKQMWMILMIVGLFVGGFGPLVAIYYYFARKKKLGPVAK
jgi:hypothetical protein